MFRWMFVAAALAVPLACGSSDGGPGPGATGGATASGGANAGGGGSATGGAPSSGGADAAMPAATRDCDRINIANRADLARFRDCATAKELYVSASDVTNLAGLEALRRIDGSLVIRSPSLRSLDGLWGLREIGDQKMATGSAYSLFVSENPLLESLTPLFGLEAFRGDSLRIANNPRLRACTAEAIVNYLKREAGFTGTSYVAGNTPCGGGGTGGSGGGTGGSGGGGSGSACDDCLKGCQGQSSCCTGTGCICQSQCAVSGCSNGYRLCCNAYYCLCCK